MNDVLLGDPSGAIVTPGGSTTSVELFHCYADDVTNKTRRPINASNVF